MNGIVTFTIATDSIDSNVLANLDEAVVSLGLKTTLPQTNGGDMSLPRGTYGAIIQFDDQMAQLKHYYRRFVDVMRELKIKGKYFVNVSQFPSFICGEL